MTTESSPDLCDPSSGGSASQSPDLPHHGNQNNNNVINDCNNNDDNTAKGRSSSSSNPREKVTKTDIWCFDDAAYYGNLHQEIQKKDRKIKQKNRRQVFQQQCDAFVRMVPALRNRTSRTPLTKKEIIKSTVEYINALKEDTLSTSLHVKEELRLAKERNVRLQQELQLWKVKVQLLRDKRQRQHQSAIKETSTPPIITPTSSRTNSSSQNTTDMATGIKPLVNQDNTSLTGIDEDASSNS